ncbi:MAG: diadenylate cyclase CdaA [Cyanobacteria bacterium]|nr:diadenylate cyclase CdaA [Cyanobacteriota bacterium]
MSELLSSIQQTGAFLGIPFNTLLSYGAQLLILISVVSVIYNRFIKRSQADQIFKGLLVILASFVGLWIVVRMLNLVLLEIMFGGAIQLLIIGLIVIFQPELRRMLLYLGNPDLLNKTLFQPENQKTERLIRELVDAVRFLSKSKLGALIVIESANNPGGNYLEAGTRLDARVTTEIILTIFQPKTPLHDGALVITPQNRISAAGVLLPLTEDPKLSWQYGTRHRAAIGLTEVSDSHCIVVSEESGHISWVHHGTLERMESPEELKKRIERLFRVNAATDDSADHKAVLPMMGEHFSQFQQLFQKKPVSKTKNR